MYFLGLALFISLVSSGFKSSDTEEVSNIEGFHLAENEVLNYTVAAVDKTAQEPLLFIGKSYVGFKQAVAFKESQGLYHLVNSYGYMGKYQFGKAALRAVGVRNSQEFLNSPVLQEKAFNALLSRNKWELRKEIPKYEGKVIGGIKVTESGLLAAAHLSGAGSVKRFLRSNGAQAFKDGFGTSLKSYLKKFGGYDTSSVIASSSAKVKLI